MQKIFCLIGLFVFFSAVIPAVLWADPPPVEPSGNTLSVEFSANTLNSKAAVALPEVVVTANRLDTPVSQVASSLTVITAKELEEKQITTVLDALNNVPGVSLIKSGGPGQLSSAFIRGANAEHTLVMMDGIPLNDPLSTTREYDDLDQLSVCDVKQIEVVRGPESPFYGSNAMGGVVNIVTQNGAGPLRGSLFFEGGAYESFREALSAGGGDEKSRFLLTASRFDTAGFPAADKAFGNTVNNGDQNSTGSLKLGFSPDPHFTNDLLVRYVQSQTHFDDGAGAGMDNPNLFTDGKQLIVGSQSRVQLFEGVWEQVLGLSFTDHLRQYTNNPSSYQPFDYERGFYDGQAAQVDWQNNLRVEKGQTLVIGLQGQQEWGNSSDDFGAGPTTLVANARTGSLFVESQTAQGQRFFETLGARLDVHSQFGTHTSYHAGVAYFIPGLETKLKATYGTAFRAPSLYQLYAPTYGNPGLAPETSTGFDAGFEQPFGKNFLTLGATYFHNDFNSLIDYDFTTNQYFNINQAQSDGVEAFADFKGVRNLTARVDYTYTHTFDLQTGQPLLRRPQHQAGLEAFYNLGALELGTSFDYVGTRDDVSFVNSVEANVVMPSYFLVNLMGSFKFDDHLKVFGRVENLFNESYEEVWGFGTPGLSVYAGTKVSL